jgi:hypothetical protein
MLLPPPPPPSDPPVPPPPTCHPPTGGLLAPLLPPTPVLPPNQPLPGRQANGQFAPGNPGKLPGTRNRVSLAIESLMEGQWESLTKTAVALALRGDTTALRLCLDRIAPQRRGSAFEISDFPKLESPADVPRAHAALIAAVTSGEITPDEAKPLSDLLADYVTAFDVIATANEVAEIRRLQEEARVSSKR